MKDENAKIIAQLLGSDAEKADLKKRAKAKGLSISNFLRELCGYPLNQTFAPEGNTRAVGNRGRWREGAETAEKAVRGERQ